MNGWTDKEDAHMAIYRGETKWDRPEEPEDRCDRVAGEEGVLHEGCLIVEGWCQTHGAPRSCDWCGERPAALTLRETDRVCEACADLERESYA